jgi:hypothetical protein
MQSKSTNFTKYEVRSAYFSVNGLSKTYLAAVSTLDFAETTFASIIF